MAEPNLEVTSETPVEKAVIKVTTQMRKMVDETIHALATGIREEHQLYQRSGHLLRVRRDQAKEPAWLTGEDAKRYAEIMRDAPKLTMLSATQLRILCDDVAHYIQADSKGNKSRVMPPHWLPQTILELGEWPFPKINYIAESPTIDVAGRIIQKSGFDHPSGVFLDTGKTTFAEVPKNPSGEDIDTSVKILEEMFVDFPFVSSADKWGAICALITIIARPAIVGPTPMFAVRAATPGTGKSLLVSAIATAATGRICPPMSHTRDFEEERKRLVGVALSGNRIALVDNVSGAYGSDIMAAAISTNVIEERLLGGNEIVPLKFSCVWMLTGNNVTFIKDFGRRVVPVDMAVDCEHPEDRGQFKLGKDDKYLAWVRANRPRIVAAALCLVRAWFAAGCPEKAETLGGFSGWDRVARQSLLFLGLPDPCETRKRLREDDDVELVSLRSLLALLHDRFKAEEFTSATLNFEAQSNPAINAALCALSGRGPERINAASCGQLLSRYRDRVAGIFVLRKRHRTSESQFWQVQETT